MKWTAPRDVWRGMKMLMDYLNNLRRGRKTWRTRGTEDAEAGQRESPGASPMGNLIGMLAAP